MKSKYGEEEEEKEP